MCHFCRTALVDKFSTQEECLNCIKISKSAKKKKSEIWKMKSWLVPLRSIWVNQNSKFSLKGAIYTSSVASPIYQGGKVKEPCRFWPFFPDFSTFSRFFADFFLSFPRFLTMFSLSLAPTLATPLICTYCMSWAPQALSMPVTSLEVTFRKAISKLQK